MSSSVKTNEFLDPQDDLVNDYMENCGYSRGQAIRAARETKKEDEKIKIYFTD